jgi:hypothetical protein
VSQDGDALTNAEQVRRALSKAIDQTLATLARAALLVA